MSRREKALEKRVVGDLALQGFLTVKVGFDGWPDRLILLGNGSHVWFEFKTDVGRLRPQQINRIAMLEKEGDRVYVIRSEQEANAAVEEAVRAL